ncbi:MAG: PPOX class F420-dependent oxidoreductase [Acidimicrobiales bacterium]
MTLSEALAFVADRHQGVLTTIRANGRPQLSNIAFAVGADGLLRISVTETRAKTKNLRRDPRASLYVPGDTFWSYAVVEAAADLSAVTTEPHDAAAEELVALYRQAQGEHPDWEEYRQAMIDQGRLVVRLRPERAYGMLGG